MAGFALIRKEDNYEKKIQLIQNSFEKKGLKDFCRFSSKDFEFLGVGKKKLEAPNFVELKNGYIFSNGTFIYKKEYGKTALELFYNDWIKNEVQNDSIFGHFNLIFQVDEHIYIQTDAYQYFPIYYNIEKTVICSSFLALCDLEENLSINKNVIIENVVTGCLFPHGETYFNEIKSFDNQICFPKIEFSILPFKTYNLKANSKTLRKQKEDQIEVINNYFENCEKLLRKGVDIGLSAGFDSRLLLSILYKFIPTKLRIHTHWKKNPDNEIKVSKKLADVVDIPLNMVPVKTISECSVNDEKAIIKDSFHFYDGQIRVNHSLFSEYRNVNYREKLLGDAKTGMAGLGGEQYRNDLSLTYSTYDIDLYIKEYIIDSVANFEFFSIDYKNQIVDNIKNYLTTNTPLCSNNKISFEETRAYFNRIWTKSGPGYRNVAENQLSYFLSPFNDPYLAENALMKINRLGGSIKFQSGLIKKYNPELAKVISDYGVNFYDQNLWYRFQRKLLGFLVPKKSTRSQLLKIFKGGKKSSTKKLREEYYSDYINCFTGYINELELKNIKVNSNLYNRIAGFGYLFEYYKEKIKK